jgi:Flp pilus assembly protein TadG
MRFAIDRWLTEMRSMVASRRGAVAIIFAFAATVLVVAIGMGIDLWQAYAVKARLQSAVDAASLAIASTDRTQFTQAQLQSRVQAYVTANYPTWALGTPGTPTLSYGSTDNIIIVTDTASVPTTLMQIIGVNSLSVSATGQAKAAWPDIDFYLLLDSSPSMAIAATQAGINTMVANTLQQCDKPPAGAGNATCGCGFACHETNPAGDSHCNSSNCSQAGLGNPGGVDNYQLSKNLGVTLRIDNLRTAAENLMTTASNTMLTNNATYRMAIYTFDVAFNTIQALTTDLTSAQTAAGNIQMLTMCQNNTTLINGTCTNNSDADTNYDNAMTNINTIIPAPGHGTKSPGDTPKEILFFVTDGAEDEKVSNCTGSATVSCSGNRQMSVMDPGWCTTIKNRGIVIAILYTEYLPLPTNGWYNTYVSKYQPAIATSLQSCATPGLYTEVLTGQDISAALSQLFITAVNSVFLSK